MRRLLAANSGLRGPARSTGVEQGSFDTLAEAVCGASDGDTIEIRGNGPFDTQPISIAGQALTIRAGQGHRPVIRLKQEALNDGATIFVTDAPLVLEGLELRLARQGNQERPERGPDAVVSSGAPLHIANCTLLNKQNSPRRWVCFSSKTRAVASSATACSWRLTGVY